MSDEVSTTDEQPTRRTYDEAENEIVLAYEWSCSEDVCPPTGNDGEKEYMVWADTPFGPLYVCMAGSLVIAASICSAHNEDLKDEAALAQAIREQRQDTAITAP